MKVEAKANNLIIKYLKTIIHFPYIDTEDGNCIGTGYMTYKSAVRCAINTVDEILQCYPNECPNNSYEMEQHIYWTNVKLYLVNELNQ